LDLGFRGVDGRLAGKGLEGKGSGLPSDLAMGVAGAVMGGLLTHSVGFSGYAGSLLTTFVAISCAALLTILASLVNGKTVCTRSL